MSSILLLLLSVVLITSLIEHFTIVEATLAVPAQIFSRIFLRPLELHLKFHPRNSFTQKSRE